ncbi:MAG: sigma-70 family RNA polymerase sigma factor, partial [Terriglobia bacterium]
MTTHSPEDVTQLLIAWRNGDKAALDKLMEVVYDDLHRRASYFMRHERRDHTLQTSALVNEAYMRLVTYKDIEWQNRAQFFGVAARAMRRVLVDHARKRLSGKRGGDLRKVTIDQAADLALMRDGDLIALDDALKELAALSPLKCQIVELRFYGGLTDEDIAEVLDVSTATVYREMKSAKAWLL